MLFEYIHTIRGPTVLTSNSLTFFIRLDSNLGSEYQMGWNKEPLNKNAWPRAPEADHEKIHKFPPLFRVHLVDSFFHVKKEISFKHCFRFTLNGKIIQYLDLVCCMYIQNGMTFVYLSF